MYKVLLVASEAEPFIKTGGLGDVLGSFSKELQKQGIDARVILPKFGDIPDCFKKAMVPRKTMAVRLGWRSQLCEIQEYCHQGVVFYFISHDYYFTRKGLYGFADDAERFSFFCRAVLEALGHLDFDPDVIHCHDWHTALVPVLIKAQYTYLEKPVVFTIHNLKYQGIFPPHILGDLLELGSEFFTMESLEFFGQVNILKGGLVFADVVTTVSDTYAKEIQTPDFGENLDGLLKKINHKLHGILNGLDYEVYNPDTDRHIYVNYHHKTWEKKQNNKMGLQKSLGLPVERNVPLIGLVCRLVPQKGLDLIAEVLDQILALDVQLVILGTGEEKYENLFTSAAVSYPDRVSAHIGFDDSLAHRIYAGSDIFLMPSVFEPCGLGQMIALRYGSIPVVRGTGGLKDTILPFNQLTGKGNGFVFSQIQGREMLGAIRRAVDCYLNKNVWPSLIINAMLTDCSWQASIREYLALYDRVVKEKYKI